VSAAQPEQQSRAPEVDALLTLRDPSRPTRQLPPELGRLVPDPLKSFEDLERFLHLDLVGKTPAARGWEASRIRTAAALVADSECIPIWLLDRLQRLAA
jgi:hypothetical protein